MRPLSFVAAAVLLASAASSSADLVAPSSVPIAVPTDFLGTLFRADGGRQYQGYISAGEFASVTQPMVITGFQVSQAAAWPPMDVTFASYIVQIGVASPALVARQGVFDPAVPYQDNMVNPVTVYSGSLTLPANAYFPGVSNPVIEFNTAHYTFQPGDNLIIYIKHSISDQPTMYTPGFATVDTSSNPSVATAVFNRDDTSPGWSGGNGQIDSAYQFNFVTAPLLVNLSTRANVGTGASILIGGFIIEGPSPKTVAIRAIGPSLTARQVPNVLVDPKLVLYNSDGTPIANNDNWGTLSAADKQTLQDNNLTPGDPRESALVVTLNPGPYTVHLSGVNDTVGNGLLEVFDVSTNSATTAVNISTRANAQTGDDVVIGGFIIEGNSAPILIRGIGDSMIALGVPGTLGDPTLELHDESGATIAYNDDWGQGPNSNHDDIVATGLAPTVGTESALLMTLPAGKYTCILRGLSGSTGIGRIDVFNLPPAAP